VPRERSELAPSHAPTNRAVPRAVPLAAAGGADRPARSRRQSPALFTSPAPRGVGVAPLAQPVIAMATPRPTR
jgi:hypothetical protein